MTPTSDFVMPSFPTLDEQRSNTSASRHSQVFPILLAATAGTIALYVLLGYSIGYESAWRPIQTFPGTHPLTAICIAILSYGMSGASSSNLFWSRVAKIGVVVALALLIMRLGTPLWGSELWSLLAPFDRIVAEQTSAGQVDKMGANTTAALLLIAFAEILRWYRYPNISQILACCSLGVVFMSVTGYFAHLPLLYVAMGPFTALGTVLIGMAVLTATRGGGFIRILMAQSEIARLGRVLLGGSTCTMLMIGWVVLSQSREFVSRSPKHAVLLVYETGSTIVITWVLILVGIARADRLDQLRSEAERSLLHAATTDALTGLLTRDAILSTRRELCNRKVAAAKIIIDLDRFRSVNEALGANEGDGVLAEVARRLTNISPGFPIGRIGGDEFAIYCPEVSLGEAEQLGEVVRWALAQPFEIRGGLHFRLTASVGVAHTDTVGETSLPQAAADAMYAAKNAGGNRTVTFVHTMHLARKRQADLEQFLYSALERDDQLSFVYQPVIRISDRKLVAVEALARWSHPTEGLIPPDRFIPLAEQTGMIVPLGLKLIELGVRQAAEWHALYPGNCPVMNINFSPLQFAIGDVIEDFLSLLGQHHLVPSNFGIEVTEGVFTGEAVIEGLKVAEKHGFKVAMDDFGVGYSSLSLLPRLPLSSVKLDRSFILHAAESAGDTAMFAAIVQLSHTLNLCVVAEGVETQEQLALVTECGCDSVQGYIFSAPVDSVVFGSWLSGRIPPISSDGRVTFLK